MTRILAATRRLRCWALALVIVAPWFLPDVARGTPPDLPIPLAPLPTRNSTERPRFVGAVQIQEVPAELPPGAAEPIHRAPLSPIKPIDAISLDIAPPDPPRDLPLRPVSEAASDLPQLAAQQPFARDLLIDYGADWHPQPASLEFCYQPLYFEEVNVERYGRTFGVLQPVVSCAQFYGRIPLLPYMAVAHPARRCTYHAHWTLPGYRIPGWERHPLTPSAGGAAAETAAIVGLFLLIP